MDQAAILARRRYYREYYKKRKQHLREYQNQYRKDNPEKVDNWETSRWTKVAQKYSLEA